MVVTPLVKSRTTWASLSGRGRWARAERHKLVSVLAVESADAQFSRNSCDLLALTRPMLRVTRTCYAHQTHFVPMLCCGTLACIIHESGTPNSFFENGTKM